jgi:glycosyltransferase involved in cell wall biosynthesis
MKILFIHRTFPAQFEFLIKYLLKNTDFEITFVTNNANSSEIDGVKKIIYEVENPVGGDNEFVVNFEDAVVHGEAVLKVLQELKKSGYEPDLIYGFSGWGSSLFVKDVYPQTPYLCYFEWFGTAENSIYDFKDGCVEAKTRALIKCNNINTLIDLTSCDGGITPTKWQKSLFPHAFRPKIKVLHEGIDTEICKPDCNTKVFLEDKKITLTPFDEVITYGTRGMEEYRGFPQFMKAAEILLKKRPNLHILIAGADKVFYGEDTISYKEKMLNELDIDKDRVHFLGVLPFESFVGILQISSVHVYLTYPMMLSWSVLNAMSAGCCIVASDTEPVREVIQDGVNGLLTDFFDYEALACRIDFALTHRDFVQTLRQNARKTILEKYSQENLLPKHLAYIKSFLVDK